MEISWNFVSLKKWEPYTVFTNWKTRQRLLVSTHQSLQSPQVLHEKDPIWGCFFLGGGLFLVSSELKSHVLHEKFQSGLGVVFLDS